MVNEREELIRQVREAGESLMKNAESIVGTEPYLSNDGIMIDIVTGFDNIPTITITREFTPEKTAERYTLK